MTKTKITRCNVCGVKAASTVYKFAPVCNNTACRVYLEEEITAEIRSHLINKRQNNV